ncbi:MAG TPA: hypothetical protein VFG71_08235 [Nitrospiraceae bacterium]|nr:hypothetical protein [Nitrospiraceae bacterium]
MTQDPRPVDQTMSGKPSTGAAGEPDVYRYEPSGIRERSGHIPIWLKLVAFGLIVWGIYYAIRYWSSY